MHLRASVSACVCCCHMWVYVFLCIHVYGSQRPTLGVFLSYSIPYSVGQAVSRSLKLTNSARVESQLGPEVLLSLRLPSSGGTDAHCHPSFLSDVGALTSNPDVTSASLTRPSPQSPEVVLKDKLQGLEGWLCG